VGAALYPIPLVIFHRAIETTSTTGGALAWALAALSLTLAFAVPLLALAICMQLMRIAAPTAAELLSRRVAMLAVAAPPIFTLTGVICFLLGVPQLDAWLLAVLWGGLVVAIVRADRTTPTQPARAALHGRWRVLHGVVALAFIGLYLSLHLSNHLLALLGSDTHRAVMKVFRVFYRSPVVEPLLILGVVFLVVSGLAMAWRLSERPSDRFRAFQLATGVYLAFAIASHVNAVLYLARVHLGIDSDWSFGIGAPTGLIHDAWNIRLVPYYLLAVAAVIAHPFAGLRIVLLGHGVKKGVADGLVVWGSAFGVLVASLIMLAMCGLRINFSGA
jgi:hypothetical protein